MNELLNHLLSLQTRTLQQAELIQSLINAVAQAVRDGQQIDDARMARAMSQLHVSTEQLKAAVQENLP